MARFSSSSPLDAARALAPAPPNVEVEVEIALPEVRDRLAGRACRRAAGIGQQLLGSDDGVAPGDGRTVVLVVVSRTAAIVSGYGLVDGESCRPVAPGDETDVRARLDGLHRRRPAGAAAIGRRARTDVGGVIGWDTYVDAMRVRARRCRCATLQAMSDARRSDLACARACSLGWRTGPALVGTELDLVRTRSGRADLALFHDFVRLRRPAAAHQFLRALVGELRAARAGGRGEPHLGGHTRAASSTRSTSTSTGCAASPATARIVHRVDGPIGVYRGFDDGTDRRIVEINSAVADATVFQSRYSLEKHRELGLELRGRRDPERRRSDDLHPPETAPLAAGALR